ncbi:MAG: magnesium-translocating P-type ATPase [candidate division KSB1 bacterium]|nr:magnesium-translocating P-type ATPase [candidate division KSB1 bacterium]MDZ7364553.1 magnesium-translocating P-type ATPase [candidate division KSB1 bacterium]MDZ7405744.1 magnesium-translocating P-type ATPase [candidate division KSB1 bacterium]
MNPDRTDFWSLSPGALLQRLETSPQGLSSDEARRRLASYGTNLLKPKPRTAAFLLFLAQFKSPITLLLVFAAVLSFFLHDPADAVIVLLIVLVSGVLGFWQEHGAANAVAKLLAMVQIKARVCRDGSDCEIPLEEVVPGDVVVLAAGDVIPGDSVLLESKDLFIDEAALTGETYPVEKSVGILSNETPLAQRTNMLFMGTHVVSGAARAVVSSTGAQTEFGKISERLKLRPDETEFERGIRRFGYFLMEVTLLFLIVVFAINVHFARPAIESFMFALALAVGLTPQLLPAIISVNLSHGAKRMAQQQVIVRRLAAIENFGSMNVLCSDKTGTLTEGKVRLHAALDVQGNPSDKVLLYAYLNASYQSGFANPIDAAIRSHRPFDISAYRKVDEVPYDFIRKRLSLLVAKETQHQIITKGALQNVLAVCSSAERADGAIVDLAGVREQIETQYAELSGNGFRTLGVAYKQTGMSAALAKEDESGMTFLGLLALFDPPKAGIVATLQALQSLGVALKIITGDNQLVAKNLGQQVGVENPEILSGVDLRHTSDEALRVIAPDVDIFAEVEPNQKERIILALRKAGNVVGYIGDGINDASALHAADVGISVDSAVDVAKEAADIVLLKHDLGVLVQGVREGRVTFANTLKYVFMATSANFGNMFSMAGASLFLPFLPLLPKQILLGNLMADFPQMAIANDRVDSDMVEQPRRWNLRFIRKFMLTFGPLSSVFDFLTFGVLMLILHATPEQFRTGWFVESLVSAPLIVLVIRTRRPFFQSQPARSLLLATLVIVAVALALPFLPLGRLFGFTAVPLVFWLWLAAIVAAYLIAAEIAKKNFYAS